MVNVGQKERQLPPEVEGEEPERERDMIDLMICFCGIKSKVILVEKYASIK